MRTCSSMQRRKQINEEDKMNPYVVAFYNALWCILKVLLIVGLLALVFFTRVMFDKWYINWLITK